MVFFKTKINRLSSCVKQKVPFWYKCSKPFIGFLHHQGAAEITQDIEKKLNEAEQQCKESLKSSWEECRPCLEDTCKNFYTNTCRRGFATFTNKVQNSHPPLPFKCCVLKLFDSYKLNQNTKVALYFSVLHSYRTSSKGWALVSALVILRMRLCWTRAQRILTWRWWGSRTSFSNLLTKVGTLVNRSVVLVSHFHHELDQTLRRAFSPELQGDKESELVLKPANKALDSAFLEGVGLEDVLESFFDFGRSVLEEFGAVVTQAVSDIHDATGEDRGGERCFILTNVCSAKNENSVSTLFSSSVPRVHTMYLIK